MRLARTDEQAALADAVGRLLAKEASPNRVREAEPLGFDDRTWAALAGLGILDAAASREATLADLAVVAELCGAHLAPVPFVEASVAARALGRIGPGLTVFTPRADGRLARGTAVADEVVGAHGAGLWLAPGPGHAAARADLGVGAVADVDVAAAAATNITGDGARAADDWRALSASWFAGLARAVLDLAVAYAKDRHQFGVPIGSFQALQHRLADAHVAVDGARLLAGEAIDALDALDPDASALAAMAWWWCGRAAEEAAALSLHVHGGYGFMLEYDVQLYVRRAKGARLALGDPRTQLAVIAERVWGTSPPRDGLDRPLDAEAETFRREVRAFVAEHVDEAILDRARTTGTMHDWDLHSAIAARGYLASGWPTEVGGLGRSAVEQTALMQEFYGAVAPVDGMGIAAMVGATLLVCGTDEQKATVVPGILRGETMCCLGYSEPDAGSDVAAVQTRAVRDGDGWTINGQKMFTTMAHEAQYVFLLTRTNLDVAKHRGLTMFLVPMDTPGIEIAPVHTLGGERTNITFYSDVHVSDSWRVGDVDAGWQVMHAALVYERAGANWGEPDHLVRSVAAWARDNGRLDDPLVRDRLAEHATAMEVGRLLVFRTAELAAAGGMPQVEGSMAKLFVTEAFTRAATDLLDAVGVEGVLQHGEPDAVLGGTVEHAFRHSTVTTIYGGSSEVQRGIIAERGLGLPRAR